MLLYPDPGSNHLLASLPIRAWQLLAPHAERVDLCADEVLYEAGSALRHVTFPSTAIVSLATTLSDGSVSEVAVVGLEGMVGVGAFMDDGVSLHRAVVQSAGEGLRMNASALRAATRNSAPLLDTLLRYTQALFTQMAQTSACSRHHALEQQLCRWLLLQHDRAAGDELRATHERIANLMGVRREGVTGSAVRLQGAGAIRYTRGRITIVDRPALEELSCECYAVVRQAYDFLQHGHDLAAHAHPAHLAHPAHVRPPAAFARDGSLASA